MLNYVSLLKDAGLLILQNTLPTSVVYVDYGKIWQKRVLVQPKSFYMSKALYVMKDA